MSKKTKKIVIIEDEEMLREALVENLTAEGYDARGCESADAAFKLMREERPDLVLSDLVMSNIDGYEVLRRFQEDLTLRSVPVIILSNLGEKENIDKAVSLGAKDYLVKSNLSLSEVTERVKAVLAE